MPTIQLYRNLLLEHRLRFVTVVVKSFNYGSEHVDEAVQGGQGPFS